MLDKTVDMNADNPRKQRGYEIANKPNQIKRLDDNHYIVKSQTALYWDYEVIATEIGWICNCPDHMYRGVKCKHIYAVEFSLKIRNKVQDNVKVIEPININTCIYCDSSNIVKDGIRHNKHGKIQKYRCKECKRYFTINIGFEKMKHDPKGITTAMQLYFSGESLRNVAKSLRLLGMDVSHQTIYNWIKKYIDLMKEYVEQLRPNVSQTWRADELWIKIKGDMKYLFALMDDETRYWIALEVAESKHKHDARMLFRKGKELTDKKPQTLITDGLPSYHEAYLREFWSLKKDNRTRHVHSIKLSGDPNNNKMERLNGEIRDREKVMRGLKKKDTPILVGYQIYHNFIREHQALNKTPAEACNIKVEGDNKWITLIQNASKDILK
ncbi:MAG: hypothetical protein KatS3mg003_0686 [Candidatus Nitrosocaldaceae archaeon]|nr:MAG: hypothetical protein KatS3mg003_0686 [Candidatus Nitrosocaldaceae archaeon]